jgi:hypothetical protein
MSADWYGVEQGLRWTDGSGEMVVAGVRELCFSLAVTGRYWSPADEDRRQAHA